jgi:hypothetical protein
MTIDNIEDIKAALRERQPSASRGTPRVSRRPAPAQNDLAELRSLLQANVGKVAEILARRLDVRRRPLRAPQDQGQEAEQDNAAAAATAGIRARREALSMLTQPFLSYYVTLETPFLIWEVPTPDLSIFLNSAIVEDGSWVKVLLDTQHTLNGEQNTHFRFYFIWQNPADYYAVANVSSALWLNGKASAIGSSGVFSGNNASLTVAAELNVIRWSGWGTDPITGQSNDQTPYPVYGDSTYTVAASLDGFGGDWLKSAKPAYATFDLRTPYEVSASLIAIPGEAVTVFEVDLVLDWWFYNDRYQTVDDQIQTISLDLASGDYLALCPQVDLEILTPPPPV